MDPEVVYRWLHKEPFVPFRIRLSNGRTYDFRNPDFALLSKSEILFGEPDPDFRVPIIGFANSISLVHINDIEPLPVQTPPAVA